MGYDWFYFAKKAYALYPGVTAPVSGGFLADHYARRRAKRGPLRAVLDAAVGLGFQAWIPLRARKVQRKFGLTPAWRRRAVAIARSRFADPQDLALFRIEAPADLDGYIRRFEDAALNKRINPLGWTPDCALADKARFYQRCREAGLPHPPVVAVVSDGSLVSGGDPAGRELVAKPADGEGGDGVTMLPAGADIAAQLARTRGVLVVQPRVAIHPELAD